MLGKTANGLFWMYRYLERAENTSRLIAQGLGDASIAPQVAEWRRSFDTLHFVH